VKKGIRREKDREKKERYKKKERKRKEPKKKRKERLYGKKQRERPSYFKLKKRQKRDKVNANLRKLNWTLTRNWNDLKMLRCCVKRKKGKDTGVTWRNMRGP